MDSTRLSSGPLPGPSPIALTAEQIFFTGSWETEKREPRGEKQKGPIMKQFTKSIQFGVQRTWVVMFDGVHAAILGAHPAALQALRLGPLGSRRLHREDPPPLFGQFGPRLRVGVEEGEVGDDDRHGEGDGQHTGQRAQGPDKHADVSLGRHVTVTHCGHGDNGPPQALGDALKVVVGVVLNAFSVIDERSKYDNTQNKEKDEQNQFLRRRLECMYENLQAR